MQAPVRGPGTVALTAKLRWITIFPAMKFRSNHSLSLQLPDLKKAEAFYSGVLGFRLLAKTPSRLEYDSGRLLLYIEKGARPQPPAPSFTVIDARAARTLLEENGCEVLEDRGTSVNFRDPFGVHFEVVED